MTVYHPDYYDLFHDDHGGDLFFYRGLAADCGGPVLELGAGTGRVVMPIARAGIEVVALDSSAGMLEVLRRRLSDEPPAVRELVSCVVGDMAAFHLDRRFPLIQIPYRAFLHNRTPQAQLSCLLCCMEHLEPGGLLAFNVFHPSLAEMTRSHGENAGRWRWVDEQPTDDGGWILLSEATLYNSGAQQVTTRLRYERYNDQGRQISVDMERLELAYLYPGDIRDRMREAGFVEVRIDGDFAGQPFTTDGQELVVRGRRPG